MRITVFTPAYNRGYIIEKLFRSLQRQTYTDFEWIVVDDGSTDDTQAKMEAFQAENHQFPIRYFRVSNGGKHRAINLGVREAHGELFYIVDSDDHLPDNALALIDKYEKSIPDDQKNTFGGVCGIKSFDTSTPIGTSFEGDTLDITVLERDAYHITGDKAEVIYTDIMRQFPFPEIEGEKFITEIAVWYKIAAAGYKLRFFNEVTMICNYLPDGLTARGKELFIKNPKGWGLVIALQVEIGRITGFKKWETYLDYFYLVRGKLSFLEVAHWLKVNPVKLWLRLFGMRVFYKLYSK